MAFKAGVIIFLIGLGLICLVLGHKIDVLNQVTATQTECILDLQKGLGIVLDSH